MSINLTTATNRRSSQVSPWWWLRLIAALLVVSCLGIATAVAQTTPSVSVVGKPTQVDRVIGEYVHEGRIATFEFTRTDENDDQELIVDITVSGPAISRVQTAPLPTTVTFKPRERTATLPLQTIDNDTQDTGLADLTVTIGTPADARYRLQSGNAASIQIADNDRPVVITIRRRSTAVTEGTDAKFSLRRSISVFDRIPFKQKLPVVVIVTGAASFRSALSTINKTFGPEQNEITIPIPTIDDDIIEDDASLTISLKSNDNYVVDDETEIPPTIEIQDNDASLAAPIEVTVELVTRNGVLQRDFFIGEDNIADSTLVVSTLTSPRQNNIYTETGTFEPLPPGQHTLFTGAFDMSGTPRRDPFTPSLPTCTGVTTFEPFFINQLTNEGFLMLPEVTFTAAPGAKVKCTFVHTFPAPATLTFRKELHEDSEAKIPDSGTFAFDVTGVTDAVELERGVEKTVTLATIGRITVTERQIPGFGLESAICHIGDQPSFRPAVTANSFTLDVDAGDAVSCTVVNSDSGRITIIENTQGGDGDFTFSLGGTIERDLPITTQDGAGEVGPITVPSGTLTITEAAAPGFDLQSISCSAGTRETDLDNRRITLDVAAGQNITCEFRNAQTTATLTLRKELNEGSETKIPDSGTFTFDVTGVTDAVELERGVEKTVTLATTGSIVVTERQIPGFGLESARCQIGGQTFQPTVTANSFTLDVAPGNAVSCTVINQQINNSGQITILKNTQGGDGGFTFSLGGTIETDLPITTQDGVGEVGPIAVLSGTLTITEAAVPGFDLQSISCSAGTRETDLDNRRITLDVAVGQNITCEFRNARAPAQAPTTATLTLTKQINAGDGVSVPDSFAFDVTGVTDAVELERDVAQTIDLATTGSVTITERQIPGFGLESASCQIGERNINPPVAANSFTLDVDAGEAVSCTVVNAQTLPKPSLIVRKIATGGGDATFSFVTSPGLLPGDRTFKIETKNGVGEMTFSNLKIGNFTITESPLDNWRLENAECFTGDKANGRGPGIFDKDSRTIRFFLTSTDEPVTCEFFNQQISNSGRITILKTTQDGDGAFKFSLGGTIERDLPITTRNGAGDVGPITVPSGTLTITEAAAPGFDLQSISCSAGTPDTDLDKRRVTLEIAPNDSILCAFNNVRNDNAPEMGSLIIKKITQGGDGTFRFDGIDTSGESFSRPVITSGGVGALKEAITVRAGPLTLTEQVAEGYKLERIACTGRPPIDNPANRSIDLDVAADEEITCTFTNVKNVGLLTIKKVTIGGDGTFNFDGSGETQFRQSLTTSNGQSVVDPIQINTGALKITEQPAEGFKLESITCAGGNPKRDLQNRNVQLDVGPGEEITCTFTNVKNVGLLTIKKVTIGGDGTFDFDGSGETQFRQTLTTSNGQSAVGPIQINTGALKITEQPAKGFKLDSIACAGGSPKRDLQNRNVQLDVGPGEEITCTFTNREVAGRTTAIIRNFLNRRAEQLTADSGRPRLLERRRNFASSGLKDALGVEAAGTAKQGTASYRTSLGHALGDQTAVKAQRLGISPGDYGVSSGPGRHRSGWDLWSEGRLSYFESEAIYDGVSSSGQFGVLRIGADYLVTPSLLVGVLAQYDRLDEEASRGPDDGYRISGHGYMVGPYAEYELTKGLYVDAKALWGATTNDVSPFKTYADRFETSRWLASARLTGSWSHTTSATSAWHFSPRAEIIYYSETSDSYVDSTGGTIGSQKVNLGRVKIGPEVSYHYKAADGTRVEPRLSVKGLWAFGEGAKRSASALGSGISERPVDEFQLQLNGGLRLEAPSGVRMELEGGYTGFGSSRNHSTGGKVNLSFPLQSK